MQNHKMVVGIAVLFGVLLSGVSAVANDTISIQAVPQEQQRPQIQQWPGFFDCSSHQVILGEFKGARGEIEMLQGRGIIQIPGGEQTQGKVRQLQLPIVQYFNPKTGTWSLIAHLENGMSCVILYGDQLQPAPNGLDNRKPPTENELKKENLEEKMDRLQPVDPRDIKTLKQATGGSIALAT
tara:strand:+ start:1705 stop:2250 length:546 start_codon:yes stop_codon:yes gene_type:complete